MSKKMKKAVVGVFGVLCVLILIAMFILGVNLIKNRWHKLDFTVNSIKVTQSADSEGKTKYHVDVSGNAKTWFYDFNTYEFNMTLSSGGNTTPENVVDSKTITVNHSGSEDFTFGFDTYDIDDIGNYTFKGENIYIDGDPKEGTDIKLFLSEHLDKMTFDN